MPKRIRDSNEGTAPIHTPNLNLVPRIFYKAKRVISDFKYAMTFISLKVVLPFVLRAYNKFTRYEHITKFVESLQLTKKMEPGEKLKRVLKKEDRDAIHDYVLQKIQAYDTNIYQLKPGEGLRFAKEITFLSRTFYIYRDKDSGELYVIPATMTKLADYNPWNNPDPKAKDSSVVRKGSYKKGKPAFISNKQINGQEPELFALVFSGETFQINFLINEARLSQLLDSHYVSRMDVGPIYFKYENNVTKQKCIFFSKKALCTLFEYINTHKIPKKIRYELMLNLLQCVKILHDQGMIHQDLYLRNILVYEEERVYLKIADFGLARNTDCRLDMKIEMKNSFF